MPKLAERLERIAIVAHESNRILCRALGESMQPAWKSAPEWQKESAREGVLYIRDNPRSTPTEIHDHWVKQKKEAGWIYGPIKDAERKEHPCMVLYHELYYGQKLKDRMFLFIVKGMLQSCQGYSTPFSGA